MIYCQVEVGKGLPKHTSNIKQAILEPVFLYYFLLSLVTVSGNVSSWSLGMEMNRTGNRHVGVQFTQNSPTTPVPTESDQRLID
jgi:hypothetical protein